MLKRELCFDIGVEYSVRSVHVLGMMATENHSCVTSSHMFRGSEYVVTMEGHGGSVLVEVEDRLSADQWRASFDSACTSLTRCVDLSFSL